MAHKSDFRNPLIDYLLPLERPTFPSAILYLAFVMKSRSNYAPTSRNTTLEHDIVTDPELGLHLEKEALSDAENSLVQAADSSLSLNTLATLLIVCNAYIASSNSQSFLSA